MSSRDFANYVAHFSASNLAVSDAGRDAMFKEGMAKDDRLVWTSATSDDWMKTHFDMPVIVSSNGIPVHGRTVLIRLPQNHFGPVHQFRRTEYRRSLQCGRRGV
jgi:hypothetical protein